MSLLFKNLTVLFFIMFVFGSHAIANSVPQWDIVPSESELKFTATQNDAPVSGLFKKFNGDLFVDPANYKASSIHIIIDMSSVSASYADITNTLTSPDWFNVAAFPKAEFKATEFKQLDDNTYEADGTLTIRDKSAPVTLKFTAEESPKNHAVVIGSATIKRNAFGVGQGEWASTDEIKDDVIVNFKISANRKM